MTQQEKQLLFIDLCARLPYDVIVSNNGQQEFLISTEYEESFVIKDVVTKIPQLTTEEFGGRRHIRDIEEIKPYLRPISSMTAEELVTLDDTVECMDWLNSHHFDYRGLIEKGLAMEAPVGMYKTE